MKSWKDTILQCSDTSCTT